MAPEYLHRLYLLLNKLCISLLNYTNDMNGCIIDEETKWPHFNLLYRGNKEALLWRKEVLIWLAEF